jgi:predicted metal-dependent HD superfamily phosphohydrolase
MDELRRSWKRAWSGMGARGDGQPLFEQLVARYSEAHRKYHSLQHLSECIRVLEPALHLASCPAEVELALWFHDAIYEPQRSDNEEQSAAWARAALLESGAFSESAERLQRLVLATRHAALSNPPDEQLVVDVDLYILGAPEERFAQYERQIREEYAFVPNWLFRRKRRAILRGFLERPHIYSTQFFRAALEERARENLRGAVSPDDG